MASLPSYTAALGQQPDVWLGPFMMPNTKGGEETFAASASHSCHEVGS